MTAERSHRGVARHALRLLFALELLVGALPGVVGLADCWRLHATEGLHTTAKRAAASLVMLLLTLAYAALMRRGVAGRALLFYPASLALSGLVALLLVSGWVKRYAPAPLVELPLLALQDGVLLATVACLVSALYRGSRRAPALPGVAP